MSKEEEVKIVPPKPAMITGEDAGSKCRYPLYLLGIVGVFVALLLLIAFLPLSGGLKYLSLILGAFLTFDIHHSIKFHVKNR